MVAPGITRHRKPFLAPLILGFALVAGAVALVAAFIEYAGSGVSVVVIVRHAEAPGTIADPPLSEAGELRAQRLARMFGDSGAAGQVTAVFATADRPSQQTATPLAARLGVPVTIVRGGAVDGLGQTLRHRYDHGIAVVVMARDSIARLVGALADTSIADTPESEYGVIYVLSLPRFGKASVVTLSY